MNRVYITALYSRPDHHAAVPLVNGAFNWRLAFLVWAAILAMASKYILRSSKRNIFSIRPRWRSRITAFALNQSGQLVGRRQYANDGVRASIGGLLDRCGNFNALISCYRVYSRRGCVSSSQRLPLNASDPLVPLQKNVLHTLALLLRRLHLRRRNRSPRHPPWRAGSPTALFVGLSVRARECTSDRSSAHAGARPARRQCSLLYFESEEAILSN